MPEVYIRAAKRATRAYWPYERQYLWCALVAQAGAESAWEADAVSSAGAEGPWQVMEGTWIEHTMRHGFSGSPFDPWVAALVAAIHSPRVSFVRGRDPDPMSLNFPLRPQKQ